MQRVCNPKNPLSILELPGRTVTKILKRLGIGCSVCGWNEDVCDVHHIRGRKIENADAHENLTYICPNCHRLAHKGKIAVESLVTLSAYVGEKWIECYNG